MSKQELLARRATLEADLAKARAEEAQLVARSKEVAPLIHTLNGALQENSFWLAALDMPPNQATGGVSGPQMVRPNGAAPEFTDNFRDNQSPEGA